MNLFLQFGTILCIVESLIFIFVLLCIATGHNVTLLEKQRWFAALEAVALFAVVVICVLGLAGISPP